MAKRNRKRAVLLALAAAGGIALLIVAAGKAPSAGPGPQARETRQDAVADRGHFTVKRTEGEAYYPQNGEWTYHLTYACPFVAEDGYTAALINDTYDLALGEIKDIALPMFARENRDGGRWEYRWDFTVMCNTDRLLSILTRQEKAPEEGQPLLTLEAQTFNVCGDTEGDPLTLRGAALLQAGVPPEKLLTAEEADLPDYPMLIRGSSDLLEEKLLPLLYKEFQALQESGVIRPDADRDDYEMEFSPARDFYALPDGRIAFFFPPALMAAPSFDAPVFAFAPAELEALLGD